MVCREDTSQVERKGDAEERSAAQQTSGVAKQQDQSDRKGARRKDAWSNDGSWRGQDGAETSRDKEKACLELLQSHGELELHDELEGGLQVGDDLAGDQGVFFLPPGPCIHDTPVELFCSEGSNAR